MSIENVISNLNLISCALVHQPLPTVPLSLSEIVGTLQQAVALLQTHPDAQPNDPLTLEELREMDGQPVWVELGPGYEGRWALVQVWAKSTNIIYLIQANGSVLHLKAEIDNGTKLYRRPPKED